MNRQRGGAVKKGPVTSRLSMPPTNPNPNLTTIQTVDISPLTKDTNRPQQHQGNNQSQSQLGNQPNRINQQQQQQQQQQKEQQQQQQQQDKKQQEVPTKEESKSGEKSVRNTS